MFIDFIGGDDAFVDLMQKHKDDLVVLTFWIYFEESCMGLKGVTKKLGKRYKDVIFINVCGDCLYDVLEEYEWAHKMRDFPFTIISRGDEDLKKFSSADKESFDSQADSSVYWLKQVETSNEESD